MQLQSILICSLWCNLIMKEFEAFVGGVYCGLGRKNSDNELLSLFRTNTKVFVGFNGAVIASWNSEHSNIDLKKFIVDFNKICNE